MSSTSERSDEIIILTLGELVKILRKALKMADAPKNNPKKHLTKKRR